MTKTNCTAKIRGDYAEITLTPDNLKTSKLPPQSFYFWWKILENAVIVFDLHNTDFILWIKEPTLTNKEAVMTAWRLLECEYFTELYPHYEDLMKRYVFDRLLEILKPHILKFWLSTAETENNLDINLVNNLPDSWKIEYFTKLLKQD